MGWVLKANQYHCTYCNKGFDKVEGFNYCPNCGEPVKEIEDINFEELMKGFNIIKENRPDPWISPYFYKKR